MALDHRHARVQRRRQPGPAHRDAGTRRSALLPDATCCGSTTAAISSVVSGTPTPASRQRTAQANVTPAVASSVAAPAARAVVRSSTGGGMCGAHSERGSSGVGPAARDLRRGPSGGHRWVRLEQPPVVRVPGRPGAGDRGRRPGRVPARQGHPGLRAQLVGYAATPPTARASSRCSNAPGDAAN